MVKIDRDRIRDVSGLKKIIKLLCAVWLGFTVAACLANRFLYKPVRSQDKERKIYLWRHGKISYAETGCVQPLLLLHSIMPGADLTEWNEQISALSKHYHVYAFDFLGYGQSDKLALTYSAYLYTSLIRDFVRNVIVKDAEPGSPLCAVIAAGLSANYAVMAARLNGGSLFSKMLLVSPGVAPASHGKFIQRLIELPVYGTLIYNLRTAPHNGENGKYAFAALHSNHLRAHIVQALRAVDIPLQIVIGGDAENDAAMLRTAQQRGDGITVFENTTLPHTECPGRFYKVCRKFL